MITTSDEPNEEPGAKARTRALHILDVARSKSGTEQTILELATACGRMPGGGFSRDLALARSLALDEGERITECYWSREREGNVLVHLHAGQENGLGTDGLIRHGMDVRSRAHTLERHAGWQRQNADRKSDRELAKIGELMGGAAALQGEAFVRMADYVRTHR